MNPNETGTQEYLHLLTEYQTVGINPYPAKSNRDSEISQVLNQYEDYDFESESSSQEKSSAEFTLTGRIISLRGHGKTMFGHLIDFSGKIQFYLKKDLIGDSDWEMVKKLKVGNFVQITGSVFRTRTGEITIKIVKVVLLALNLRALPEKWHGLKDIELRYRRRYLDLIVNPDVKKVFEIRSRVISFIRRELDAMGYLEVETPMMHSIPGGAAARPFITHHNALDMQLYMRIAPELYLKRLLVGGFEKVYELGRVFRNEGLSNRHNPEFTMLELYQAYGDYLTVMELSETLISKVVKLIKSTTVLCYQDQEIDFVTPFKRVKMTDLVSEKIGSDCLKMSAEELKSELIKSGLAREDMPQTYGEMINFVFEEYCEQDLMTPTFVTFYPMEISPLSKPSNEDSRFAERFELFVYGREIANAFSELNNPQLQQQIFEKQVENSKDNSSVDYDYVRALEYGMPPAGGLGIGIDRLVMFLVDAPSIRDVILFPLLRQETTENTENMEEVSDSDDIKG